MASARPLKIGATSGTDVLDIAQLTDSDDVAVATGRGVVDAAGDLIRRTSGVPVVGDQPIDGTIQRNTEYRILGGASPRGTMPFQDHRGGFGSGAYVLAQKAGFWLARTRLNSEDGNPELVDPLYQTPVTGTFTTYNATLAVDDLVTGATSGATGRISAIDTGAKTFTVSLYNGTFSSGETIRKTGSSAGSDEMVGVSLTGSMASVVEYYTDTSGRKIPKVTSGGSYYTALGVGNDYGVTPNYSGGRWATLPKLYNRGFRVPKGLLTEGAAFIYEARGVWKNTMTSGDPRVDFVLQFGGNIFGVSNLQANNFDKWTHFRSPTFPAGANETPFLMRITLWNRRLQNRTQGQIMLGEWITDPAVWGGSGTWRVMNQRGTDKEVSPSSFPGWDLETGEDAVNKRDLKIGSVWMGVTPDVHDVVGEQFSVAVHSIQATLVRGNR